MATYFPIEQNENGRVPDPVIAYSLNHFIGDREFYVIFGPNNWDPSYPNFYGVAWDGDGSEIWGYLSSDSANYFDFQKQNTLPTNFVSFEVGYMPSTGSAFERGSNYSGFMTTPYRFEVSRMDAVSSGKFYDQNGNVLINFPDEVEPDGFDFEIKNMYAFGEWTKYGAPSVTRVYWRGLRGRIISGRLTYYNGSNIEDGALKCHIVSNAVFDTLETYNGSEWTPVANNQLPFDFFYRKRTNELGEFYYGLSFENTTIPRFSDETNAQDYLDGELNESDADNWGDIAPNYPNELIPVGTPDTEPTTMGGIFTRAFFSQQYICSSGAIQEISNALFDTDPSGKWESIKKGLEMYGDSPVDDIQGLMFFPFALTTAFHNTQNQNYIYFGGYKFDLQNNTVDKILFPDNEIDFGTWYCPERFSGGFRDFAPYRRLYCYLPYIGWCELDIKRYIGKNVGVKYYVDTRTGGCMACLFANGILYDYFNGQMGVSMPICATDFVAYANAQIQTLLGAKSVNGGSVENVARSTASGFGQGLSEAGLGVAGMTASLGVAGAIGVTKTMYGLTQNNINNFNVTKGGSSSMLNCKLPQQIMFLDEVQDGTPTANELSLMGYPSNTSGRIVDFSGYLEVDAVNLVCDTATEHERAEIIAYLKNGIII